MIGEASGRTRLMRELAKTPSFPRDVEMAVLMALPVSILRIGRLSIDTVHAELRRRSIRLRCDVDQRPLRGCLVAHGDHGIIFVESDDAISEQRFTVAHEAAHFLVDYLEPRHQALDALGEGVRGVLDGRRLPTDNERIHALLDEIPLRAHFHSMLRDPSSYTGTDEVTADTLAFEMLAPRPAVEEMVSSREPSDRREAAWRILTTVFGIPIGPAREYARMIYPVHYERPLRAQFGL